MQRSHKIRLVPNKTQLIALKKAAGTSRFVYNWGLEQWEKQYAAYKEKQAERPDAYSLSRKWTKEKPDWAKEVNTSCQTQALLNLGKAWHSHWNKGTGKPAFKSKHGKQSFYVSNSKAYVQNYQVHLPKVGKVKMRELLRFSGKITAYTVSCEAEQWYVAVQVELPDKASSDNTSVVGVDVGIKDIAVASDGTVCDNPKALKEMERKLKRLQRKLARQQKGSLRRLDTLHKLQKLNLTAVNKRQDKIHKFTSALAKNHGLAVVETLDVQEMKENGSRWLRRLLQDTAMKEVHRQLEYKMRVEHAPKYYKSSRTCSNCGEIKLDLPLHIRVYCCEKCHSVKDRDVNAADNLKNMRWVTASMPVESPKETMKRETETDSLRV